MGGGGGRGPVAWCRVSTGEQGGSSALATAQQREEEVGEGLREGVHTALGFGGGVRGAAGRDKASRLQHRKHSNEAPANTAPLADKYGRSCGRSQEMGGGGGAGGGGAEG